MAEQVSGLALPRTSTAADSRADSAAMQRLQQLADEAAREALRSSDPETHLSSGDPCIPVRNYAIVSDVLSTPLYSKATTLDVLIQELGSILSGLDHPSYISYSFARWSLCSNDRDKIHSFLEKLRDFIQEQTQPLEDLENEASEITSEILTDLQKGIQSLIQQSPDLIDLTFILKNIDRLQPALDMFTLYSQPNIESMSCILGNELKNSYQFSDPTLNEQLLQISKSVVQKWTKWVESNGLLCIETGYKTLLEMLLQHLETEKPPVKDQDLKVCDNFGTSQHCEAYIKMYMHESFRKKILPRHIPALEEECRQSLDSLRAIDKKLDGLFTKEPIKAQRYLSQAPLAQPRDVKKEALNLGKMLCTPYGAQDTQLTIRQQLCGPTLESYNKLVSYLEEITTILSKLEKISCQPFNAKNIFEESIYAKFPDRNLLPAFVFQIFSKAVETYRPTLQNPSCWDFFVDILNGYKQDPSKPLKETLLVKIEWKLPAELAEGSELYNLGWRTYNQKIIPLPKERLSSLAKTMTPGFTLVCLVFGLEETQKIQQFLEQLEQDQEFQKLLKNLQS